VRGPHAARGHLFGREAADAGGRHDLRGLLTAAPGNPLQRGRRDGLQQDRARTSPGRSDRVAALVDAVRREDALDAPKLRSDDGRNTVIRPLCFASEADVAAFAASAGFPIIPCDLCGSQEDLQRKRVKRLLSDLEREHPGVRASLFASMGNVLPAHLLDARLYPRDVQSGADPWIDGDDCAAPSPLPALARI